MRACTFAQAARPSALGTHHRCAVVPIAQTQQPCSLLKTLEPAAGSNVAKQIAALAHAAGSGCKEDHDTESKGGCAGCVVGAGCAIQHSSKERRQHANAHALWQPSRGRLLLYIPQQVRSFCFGDHSHVGRSLVPQRLNGLSYACGSAWPEALFMPW